MSSTSTVRVSVKGSVASVCLDRPESYNAFSKAMRGELSDALIALEKDPSVTVVVLHGAGRGFSAGVDLKEGSEKPSEEVLEGEFRPFLECIWQSQKLYIAAVHGHAAGIAAALALACDFVVMDETARLTLAFSAIGLIPDGGLVWHLNRALGPRLALEAIIEGRQLAAQYCIEHGLANKMVGAGEALSVATTWAEELAKSAPLAVSAAKRLISAFAHLDLAETFSAEAKAQTKLAGSSDHRRGVDAFLNGTMPEFRGD